MERCELCEVPNIAARCAGLDVPQLSFCAACAPRHAASCPHIKIGAAQLVKVGRENQP
jgi:hypothetical protein